jgi:hypothetical protein
MKRLLLTIAIFSYLGINGQTYRVKGGLNLSTMLAESEDPRVGIWSDDFKMKPGFHIGATAEFKLTEIFSFETGLLLTTKGYKMERERFFMDTYESEVNFLYLDIPLLTKASFDIGDTRIYGVFGPYLGIGLSGKGESKAGPNEKETVLFEYDVEWGRDFKRTDFGLTLGAGVELNSIQIGLTYSLGLANIYLENGETQKHRVLGISLGYRLGEN